MNEVVKYLQECNIVGEPTPSTKQGDKLRYCTYLRVTRHDTTKCNSLKNVIEELVQKVLLDKFIKKDSSKKDYKKLKGSPDKKQKTPRILVIYGGSIE